VVLEAAAAGRRRVLFLALGMDTEELVEVEVVLVAQHLPLWALQEGTEAVVVAVLAVVQVVLAVLVAAALDLL